MKIPTRFSSQDAMVLSSGLLTGLAVLGGLLWLGERAPDFNPMGWYVLFIIPVGAVLVGIVAGLGYGLASFWSGRRITHPLMVVILLLQAVVYVLAHWVDFHRNDLVFEDGTKVGFMEYYDAVTRSMTFTSGPEDAADDASALGLMGYLFRLLEVAGFSFGGLVIPLMLVTRPYCEGCSRYMRRWQLAELPGAVPFRKISNNNAPGWEEHRKQNEEVLEQALQTVRDLTSAIQGGAVSDVRNLREEAGTKVKAARKAGARIVVSLFDCTGCRAGLLTSEFRVPEQPAKVLSQEVIAPEVVPVFDELR